MTTFGFCNGDIRLAWVAAGFILNKVYLNFIAIIGDRKNPTSIEICSDEKLKHKK